MKLQLLILGCLPILATAQEVKPILSSDYLNLIHGDSNQPIKKFVFDSTNAISKSVLQYHGNRFFDNTPIKNIRIGPNNAIILQPVVAKFLYIAGTASSAIEIQHINHLPALQNQYAQGESENGALVWKGPETGEMFSFGPAINQLEFDGISYLYDVNGRLVPKGMANGISANNYNNSIFRSPVLFTNSVTLQAKYQSGYQHTISASITAAQGNQNSFIIDNKNQNNNIAASLEATNKGFTIGGNYRYQQQNFSNSNRSGFLNRVYQNALLTPISFDNSQGNTIGNTQRSYSPQADNPYFLLENNDHFFKQQEHFASLNLEQKFQTVKIKLTQLYEKNVQQSDESYKPGTAIFPNGMPVNRHATNANYLLDFNTQYAFPYHSYHFSAIATFNYVLNNNQSNINYLSSANYQYSRVSNDAAVSFAPTFRNNSIETGLSVANKMYASTTAAQSNFWLPSVAAYVQLNRFRKLNIKLSTAYNRFNSELPLNQSFAENNLLQYSVGNALQYLPVTEISSFNNLLPIEHKEYTAGLNINYVGKITFSADWFSRQTDNDVFAIPNAAQLQLQNLASHSNQGIELQLNHFITKRKFNLSNSISFVSYRTKVTDVKTGYDFTPIAGFIDVHKAIVKGQPFGVIVGNTFLKDANKNVIIGADGFPLVNNALSVIGNPNPDFIMKMSHHFGYKKWDVNIDWEWKKGGDIWNGTEAMLDYYGRSASSAALRNTTNYIFNGVQVNGGHNAVPVSFYDVSKPVNENRWVRYGPSGVAENYIQKADAIRLNNVGISYKIGLGDVRQELVLTAYASNILIWSAYKGADPNQLLYDQANGAGLDFFNLPSYRSLGVKASLKF